MTVEHLQRRRVGARWAAAVLAAISILVVIGCTSDAVSKPVPAAQSTEPTNSATPELTEAARALLGGTTGPVDELVDDASRDPSVTPFGFLRVSTETTPTTAGAVSLLLEQARAQAEPARHYVLRVDIGEGSASSGEALPTVVLIWNPTALQARSFGYDATPGPGSLIVYGNAGGSATASPYANIAISGVTADALQAAAAGKGQLHDRIQAASRLQ